MATTEKEGWSGEPRSTGTLQQARRQLDWPSDREFRVLSIDGGGIKGLFAADLLARLESDHLRGENIASRFDLITGTSTGGIIALALGMGFSASSVRQLYVNAGAKIFPRKQSFGILRPAYQPTALRAQLEQLFGSRTLGDAKHRLCVPSADGQHGDVAVFKTPHHPDYRRDWTIPLVDIALATSAAPTFLRVHKSGGYKFVDGGVWANNPVMVGLVDALSCFNLSRRQIRILSIGGGARAPVLKGFELLFGGVIGWVFTGRLFESMMHYTSLNADGQAGLLIGRDRLLRIQPQTPEAQRVHMTDYIGAMRLLPAEVSSVLSERGTEVANLFLSTTSERAIFFHGPNA